MPTYTNPSSAIVFIKNSQGGPGGAQARGTIETVHFCDHEGLGITEVSETPYYDREVADDVLTGLSASPQTVEIDAETRRVVFLQITGMVTVYRNHVGAVPVMRDHGQADGNFLLEVDTRTKRFLVTGSGSCRLLQWRKD